ncbi:hypothetical protein SO802_016653 [Lithocarpus litseifolius]|uniref:Ycf15 n=1 Tax=Lithocarpus litseifolius TaxID=425828 RepID=A0AAW2CX39_9ROSI
MMDRDIKCLTQYDWNDSTFMNTKIGPRSRGMRNPCLPSTLRQNELQRREKQPLLYDPEKEISNIIRAHRSIDGLRGWRMRSHAYSTCIIHKRLVFLFLFSNLGSL